MAFEMSEHSLSGFKGAKSNGRLWRNFDNIQAITWVNQISGRYTVLGVRLTSEQITPATC